MSDIRVFFRKHKHLSHVVTIIHVILKVTWYVLFLYKVQEMSEMTRPFNQLEENCFLSSSLRTIMHYGGK